MQTLSTSRREKTTLTLWHKPKAKGVTSTKSSLMKKECFSKWSWKDKGTKRSTRSGRSCIRRLRGAAARPPDKRCKGELRRQRGPNLLCSVPSWGSGVSHRWDRWCNRWKLLSIGWLWYKSKGSGSSMVRGEGPTLCKINSRNNISQNRSNQ